METGSLLTLTVLAALICLVLSSYKPEFSFIATVAAGSLIFISVLIYVVPTVSELGSLMENAGIENGYFRIAFKALGICLITQFAADTCRDFGQSALASKAEFIGRCAIFILSVPLIENVLQAAISLIGEI